MTNLYICYKPFFTRKNKFTREVFIKNSTSISTLAALWVFNLTFTPVSGLAVMYKDVDL